MRLKNQKPSKNFRDETWIPNKMLEYDIDWEEDPLGAIKRVPIRSAGESILVNPSGYLGYDYTEEQLLKNGADPKEVLFLRALKEWENTSYIQKPKPDKKKRK